MKVVTLDRRFRIVLSTWSPVRGAPAQFARQVYKMLDNWRPHDVWNAEQWQVPKAGIVRVASCPGKGESKDS